MYPYFYYRDDNLPAPVPVRPLFLLSGRSLFAPGPVEYPCILDIFKVNLNLPPRDGGCNM